MCMHDSSGSSLACSRGRSRGVCIGVMSHCRLGSTNPLNPPAAPAVPLTAAPCSPRSQVLPHALQPLPQLRRRRRFLRRPRQRGRPAAGGGGEDGRPGALLPGAQRLHRDPWRGRRVPVLRFHAGGLPTPALCLRLGPFSRVVAQQARVGQYHPIPTRSAPRTLRSCTRARRSMSSSICPPVQCPDAHQKYLSHVLGVPMHKVVVRTKRLGECGCGCGRVRWGGGRAVSLVPAGLPHCARWLAGCLLGVSQACSISGCGAPSALPPPPLSPHQAAALAARSRAPPSSTPPAPSPPTTCASPCGAPAA